MFELCKDILQMQQFLTLVAEKVDFSGMQGTTNILNCDYQ